MRQTLGVPCPKEQVYPDTREIRKSMTRPLTAYSTVQHEDEDRDHIERASYKFGHKQKSLSTKPRRVASTLYD